MLDQIICNGGWFQDLLLIPLLLHCFGHTHTNVMQNCKLQVPDSDPDFKTSIQVGKTKLFPCFVFAVFSSTVAPHSGDLQFSLMVPRLQELAGVESDNN